MVFDAHIAATRFGTGLSPAHSAPERRTLITDITGPDAMAAQFPIGPWADRAADVARDRALRGADDPDTLRSFRRAQRANYLRDISATLARGTHAMTGFRERLTWFWADHFTVSRRMRFLRFSVSAYVDEAIRPFLTGRFEDLLIQAALHPAMLLYLDQVASVGPNSRFALRREGRGLNENLAREILELHTMGAGAAYTQADVRELAELLTGLKLDPDTKAQAYNPRAAEPGPETILGQTIGVDRGRLQDVFAGLRVIARHPDTARHIARKLVVHFISDTPDPDLVNVIAMAYLDTDGDLLACYRAMLDHDGAWRTDRTKVRQPFEWIVASMRALHVPDLMGDRLPLINQGVIKPLDLMGQTWQNAPGPDGWPEAAAHWITPQGLAARLEWAMTLPARLRTDLPDPRLFLETALGPLAGSRLHFAAQAAESRADGIGLILSSAEFQRR